MNKNITIGILLLIALAFMVYAQLKANEASRNASLAEQMSNLAHETMLNAEQQVKEISDRSDKKYKVLLTKYETLQAECQQ